MAERLLEAMGLVAELAAVRGVSHINKLPGCWECVVDEQWTLAMNGHREATKWKDVLLQPFHVALEFNGWPAGVFSPQGGVIAAGELANENTFCGALKTAITKAKA